MVSEASERGLSEGPSTVCRVNKCCHGKMKCCQNSNQVFVHSKVNKCCRSKQVLSK